MIIDPIPVPRGKKELPGHKAEIEPGQSIRLFGTTSKHRYKGFFVEHFDVSHEKTFRVGDLAVYTYSRETAEIKAISAKTVTFQLRNGSTRRVTIYEFDYRNFNFG